MKRLLERMVFISNLMVVVTAAVIALYISWAGVELLYWGYAPAWLQKFVHMELNLSWLFHLI